MVTGDGLRTLGLGGQPVFFPKTVFEKKTNRLFACFFLAEKQLNSPFSSQKLGSSRMDFMHEQPLFAPFLAMKVRKPPPPFHTLSHR